METPSLTTYFAKDPTELGLSVSAVVWRENASRECRELLLMKRSDNGHWGIPGGYVEPGESVTEATQHEVMEATSYSCVSKRSRRIGVHSDPARRATAFAPDRRVHLAALRSESSILRTGAIPKFSPPKPPAPLQARVQVH